MTDSTEEALQKHIEDLERKEAAERAASQKDVLAPAVVDESAQTDDEPQQVPSAAEARLKDFAARRDRAANIAEAKVAELEEELAKERAKASSAPPDRPAVDVSTLDKEGVQKHRETLEKDEKAWSDARAAYDQSAKNHLAAIDEELSRLDDREAELEEAELKAKTEVAVASSSGPVVSAPAGVLNDDDYEMIANVMTKAMADVLVKQKEATQPQAATAPDTSTPSGSPPPAQSRKPARKLMKVLQEGWERAKANPNPEPPPPPEEKL